MVTFELDKNATLTSKEKRMLTEARKLPVSYDSDCPELSDDMEKAFVAARKAKPYHGEPLTLYVSAATAQAFRQVLPDQDALRILRLFL